MSHSDCILYYGTRSPRWEPCSRLFDSYVVLQAYHEIVRSGLFGRYFPHCERLVYWNPTRVSLGELGKMESSLPILGTDDRWNLALLDLGERSCRKHVVDMGLQLLAYEGVSGLFVDDLDSWAGRRIERDSVRAVFCELKARSQRPFSLFVNRGFCFWHELENLSGVLLESIHSEAILTATPSDLEWYRAVLDTHLELLVSNTPQVSVFGSFYTPPQIRDSAETDRRSERAELAKRFDQLVTKTLQLNPSLNVWPEALVLRGSGT